MSGISNEPYIDTFEDADFRNKTISDGETVWTRTFPIKGYGNGGVQGLYLDCTGSGTFEIVYETDPGEEAGEQKDRVHDWFQPSYRNPLKTAQPVIKDAIPMSIVIGKYLRFGIKLTGGTAVFNSLKLCYE